MDNSDELLTVWRAAEEKGCSRQAIYAALYRGIVRRATGVDGRTVLIRRSDLERYTPQIGGRRARRPQAPVERR